MVFNNIDEALRFLHTPGAIAKCNNVTSSHTHGRAEALRVIDQGQVEFGCSGHMCWPHNLGVAGKHKAHKELVAYQWYFFDAFVRPKLTISAKSR